MAPANPPHNNTAAVLVVEDNMDAADSMARFLRVASGFDVRVAYDGAAGVRSAEANPPDVVVCDIQLPRLNGLQVAEQLCALGPARPLLIAVTAFGAQFPEDRARAAGFDHYLTKPADPFAIEGLINDHLRRTEADDA
jgi:DNA-binding response OmpR family regulator